MLNKAVLCTRIPLHSQQGYPCAERAPSFPIVIGSSSLVTGVSGWSVILSLDLDDGQRMLALQTLYAVEARLTMVASLFILT